MIRKSIYFKNKAYELQQCYTYAIEPFSIEELFRGYTLYETTFGFDRLPSFDVQSMAYILVGKMIEVSGGDYYDRNVPIALGDNLAELHIFADIEGLSPLNELTKH